MRSQATRTDWFNRDLQKNSLGRDRGMLSQPLRRGKRPHVSYVGLVGLQRHVTQWMSPFLCMKF